MTCAGWRLWLFYVHDEVCKSNSYAQLEDMHDKFMKKERTISQLLVERKNFEDKLVK